MTRNLVLQGGVDNSKFEIGVEDFDCRGVFQFSRHTWNRLMLGQKLQMIQMWEATESTEHFHASPTTTGASVGPSIACPQAASFPAGWAGAFKDFFKDVSPGVVNV
jgi:hypothetical protein